MVAGPALAITVILNSLTSGSAGDAVGVNCDCGDRVGFRDLCNKTESLKGMKTQTRMVGGCDVKSIVPWYVLILIKPGGQVDTMKCGGSLINKFWVISSAHCFCNVKLPCKKGPNGGSVIDYNIRETMRVHFLVSEMPQYDNPASLIFTEIIVHEKYDTKAKQDYDFALGRLSYPVADNEYGMGRLKYGKFDPDKIMPICLPPDDKFTDNDGYGLTVGMGIARTGCLTTNAGPDAYAYCAHKWVDKRRDKGSDGKYTQLSAVTYEKNAGTINCVKSAPPPSHNNPLCKAFYEKVTADPSLIKGIANIDEVLMVEKSDLAAKKGKYNITHCYNTAMSENGWCGTCNMDAKKGTVGYCTDDDEPQNPAEIPVVDPDKGWGFCTPACGQSKFVFKLKISNLYILDDEFCNDLINERKVKDFKVNIKVEICAAFVQLVEAKTFTYQSKDGGYSFEAASIPEKEQVLFTSSRLKKSKLKKYIMGGVDTCQGDSGGPLWVEKDGKAYLVGVVNRGRQCGNNESPGIYGRVKMVLPWIKQHTMKPVKFNTDTQAALGNVQSYSGKVKDALKIGEQYEIKPFCEDKPKRTQLKTKKTKKKKSKSKKKKKSKKKNKKHTGK